jgi:hypothetical protein
LASKRILLELVWRKSLPRICPTKWTPWSIFERLPAQLCCTLERYIAVLMRTLGEWLTPLRDFTVERDPTEKIIRYVTDKMEHSRTAPAVSRPLCMEMLAGAPLLGDMLRGPPQKACRRENRLQIETFTGRTLDNPVREKSPRQHSRTFLHGLSPHNGRMVALRQQRPLSMRLGRNNLPRNGGALAIRRHLTWRALLSPSVAAASTAPSTIATA